MIVKGNMYVYGDVVKNTTNNYNIESVGNFYASNDGTSTPTNNGSHQDASTTQLTTSPELSILGDLKGVLDFFNGFDPQGTMKAIVERIMQIPDDSPQAVVRSFFLHSIKANAGTKIRRGNLQLAPIFKLAGFLSTKTPFNSSGPELVENFPTTLHDPSNMRANLKAYFRKGATQTPDPNMKQDEMDFYDWISKQI